MSALPMPFVLPIPPPPQNMHERYQRLQTLLTRYSSRLIIQGLLRSAAERAAVPLPPVDGEQMNQLIKELLPGLVLFCPAQDVPKLKLALTEVTK